LAYISWLADNVQEETTKDCEIWWPKSWRKSLRESTTVFYCL